MPVNVDSGAWISAVNARCGVELADLGIAQHGEIGGAAYVRWPDGHHSVLTRSLASPADLERTGQVLTIARSDSLPVPRYEHLVPFDEGTIIVQERLPGATARPINEQQLNAMIAINERFAGVLAGHSEVPVPRLRLHDPTWHAPLHRYSDRSRQVLAAIRRIDDVPMTGDDLVHPDFHPENILFGEGDSITGVVDWDGAAARGDHRFALIKFRFELAWSSLYPPVPDPEVVDRLDQYLDTAIGPDLLRRYWAHWSLRVLGATIRDLQAPEADIELHIDLALSRLG